MTTFFEAALNEGYTPDEINAHLAQRADAARAEGYSDAEIQAYVDEQIKQKNPFNAAAVAAPAQQALATRPSPKTLTEAFSTGWGWSTTGLATEMTRDNHQGRLPATAITSETPFPLAAAGTLGGVLGDIPAFMTGMAAGGGPASPITAVAGGMGLTSGLRKVFIDALTNNEIETKQEFAQRTAATMWETAKGWITGAATAGAGSLASKALATSPLPGAVNSTLSTAAELTAMTEVSARLEGHAPEPRDFALAAVTLGVIKAVAPAWTAMKPITGVYEKTGVMPEQLLKDALAGDKGVWQDTLDGRVPEAYKDRVEQPTSAPTQAQKIDALVTAFKIPIEKTSGNPEYDRTSGSVYMTDLPDAEFLAKYGATKEDVTLHELGHALLNKWDMTGEIKGPNYAALRAELRSVRQEFKGGALEIATDKMRRHFNKSQELLADGLAVWVKDPSKRASMPEFSKLFSSRLGDIERALAKSASAPGDMVLYHGTPHSFETFDLQQIGTGEGAQAFGHGMYFAENKAIAESYAKQLSTPQTPGKVYETRVPASTVDDMLDWDAPLSAQSASVRQRVQTLRAEAQAHIESLQDMSPDALGAWGGAVDTKGLQQLAALPDTATGKELHAAMVKAYPDGQIETAARLYEAGIPGVKYLDAVSRKKGAGTRNYVVFDPEQLTATVSSAPQPTSAPNPKTKTVPTLTPEQQAQARAFMEHPFAEVPQAPNEPSRPTHLNYNYLQTTTETKQALAQLSTIYEDKIKAQQLSPRGWAKSNQEAATVLADLLQSDADTVMKFAKNETPGPSITANLLARKELIVTAAEDLMRARAGLLAKGDAATPEDLAAFMARSETVATIGSGFLGNRADVARAFNALKSTQRQAERAQAILDAINDYGGEAGVKDLVKHLGEFDNPAQVVGFAKLAVKSTTREQLIEAWKAMLVSGLRTNEVNFLSTAMFTTLKLPIEAIAAARGLARTSGERVEIAEIPARAVGMLAGVRDGLKLAGAILRTGEQTTGAKTDTFQAKIPGTLGEVVRLPFRPLAASDALLRTVNERGELYALATRQAVTEGLSLRDDAFMARVNELVANPTPAMTEQVQLEGDRRTFTAPLGPGGQAFQRAVKEWGWEWIFPFITTPGNIFKEAARMTPGVSKLVREWNADYEAGGIRKDRAKAEVMVGSAIMMAVFAAAQEGGITGGGQPDPRRRATDRAAGWKPYAVKINGQYYDGYLRMAPIGPLIGLTVDMQEFWGYMTHGERDQWARMLAFAFANNATNQSFFTGATNMVNVLQDPSRYGQNYFESLAGSIVPSLIGQTTADQDPYVRQIQGMRDAIQARIPGWREGLMPQRDLFGQPIPSPERLWTGSPFTVSAASTDKVRTEASRVGFASPVIPKSVDVVPGMKLGATDTVQLTPEQRDVFNSQSGQLAHAVLEKEVASPGWDAMPLIIKRQLFEKAFKLSRDYAQTQLLLHQDPAVTKTAVQELQRRLKEEK